MTDFYVRWGDDVQPYILQLASEHIGTLRLYCNRTIRSLLEKRAGKSAVIAVTSRVDTDMLKAKAFHRFPMFGFEFELRESAKKQLGHKQEFVLRFAATPDFEPEDMPPRLRRVDGKSVSAQPTRRRRPRAYAPAQAAPRAQKPRKHGLGILAYRLETVCVWIRTRFAALTSSLGIKLCNMRGSYLRLSRCAFAMWRRRPRVEVPRVRATFLTSRHKCQPDAASVARLEPRLIGTTLSLLLFTYVAPRPGIDWNAYPFGRLAEDGERIRL